MAPMTHDCTPSTVRGLQRQIRILQAVVAGLASVGVMAATLRPDDGPVRAGKVVLVDQSGRERIVLDGGGVQGRPSIEFRSTGGTTRLLIGEEPDPSVNGRRLPRLAPAWGTLIFDPHGDERGGLACLDNGRSVVSLDRSNGDGVDMTVNERSGFAGMVANYPSAKSGEYHEAIRLGVLGTKAFVQAANVDGSASGALVTSGRGRPTVTDVVQH